jgi:hypothetical protein
MSTLLTIRIIYIGRGLDDKIKISYTSSIERFNTITETNEILRLYLNVFDPAGYSNIIKDLFKQWGDTPEFLEECDKAFPDTMNDLIDLSNYISDYVKLHSLYNPQQHHFLSQHDSPAIGSHHQ